ncbi:hypothetical protein [Rhodoferax fermentans]|uniref:Uncharacterized protein n=1 Tax=Rhodoferax fermentans TaxID=28066 RepID=A0A1T1AP81_RHOFE|nr:hypothetical protein [Rhodoferax fermentans]MBK1683455.1 hypothetical protein [Rhodoferax fermentans]OOV05803.1 hypothetical protein RF819_02930 [Rhodoferax fermentans]
MATVSALRKPKVTVGSLIDQLHTIRSQKRELAVREKELTTEYEATEQQLMALMDAEGVTKSTGKTATASLSTVQTFNFIPETGFDAFFAYAAKIKRPDLLQRRISVPAVRELWSMKGAVPGLVPFEEKKIGLRDL